MDSTVRCNKIAFFIWANKESITDIHMQSRFLLAFYYCFIDTKIVNFRLIKSRIRPFPFYFLNFT